MICVDRQRLKRRELLSLWSQIEHATSRGHSTTDTYRRAHVVRQIRALVVEQTRHQPHWTMAVTAGFETLLVTLARMLARRPPAALPRGTSAAVNLRFRGTLEWIENNFSEPIRIPQLAALAKMSYRSYTAHFRLVVGRTVTEHVGAIRSAFALSRLRDGASVLEASLDAGFQDLSHFYRVFRHHTGSTPARARPQRRLK